MLTAPYAAGLGVHARTLLTEREIERLLHRGYVVIDNVFREEHAAEFVAAAAALDAAGHLKKLDAVQSTQGQRDDRILNLSEHAATYKYWSQPIGWGIYLLKGFADALNPALSRHHAARAAAGDLAHAAPPAPPATLDAVLTTPPDAMLATYPGGGARYVAHVDNRFSQIEGRRLNPREVTAILYANPPDWDSKRDGGSLRLYLKSETRLEAPNPDTWMSEIAEVAPLGGRLVIFFSALWHEVLPAYRERRALTLWIFRPTVDRIS
eukprot:gnl/TRDRNA2_/TRDRNA2_51502_c1_seq1.p1 gnl/TRDRNA2_/TRDRNA2_51502_c1~~gnl/TRDRNA2_/TRDRNA2_51502_c1_seq1.p1  ORF type:complete len:292 (-),score=39.44 gnl/TRDRNA2_/TRDRNA2_51502_c1_seq1:5-802(-)